MERCPNCEAELLVEDYKDEYTYAGNPFAYKTWKYKCPECLKKYSELIMYKMVESLIKEEK